MHHLRRPEHSAARKALARSRGYLALLACFTLGCCLAQGQSPADGALYGILTDNGNHALAAAQVIVTAPAVTITIPTARDGTFVLPHLAPGDYTFSIRIGTQTFASSQPIHISASETLELRAGLSASGAITTTAVPGATQPSASKELPDEDDDGLFTYGGLTAMQAGSLLDGASATQTYNNVPAGTGSNPAPDPDGDPDSAERATGPANGLGRGRHAGVAYLFAQPSTREFRVTGQNYSAQTSRAGAVATFISRSGTPALHGAAFFTLRSQAFAAHDPFAFATTYTNGVVTTSNVKPHDLREGFGGALGGPIPRLGRMVFFESIDAQLRGFPAISSPGNPEFYTLTAQQMAVLNTRGVTPAQVNTALNYLSSLTGVTPRRADQALNFLRVDRLPPPVARRSLAVAAEYNLVRWHSPAGLLDAPTVARGRASLGNAAGSLDQFVLRATQTWSPHTLNQARFALLRDLQYETPRAPLPQEAAIAPGGLAPEVNIGPEGLLFGTPATLSQLAYPDERRVEVADTFTLVRGHHQLQIGGEVAFLHDAVATLANPAGTFRYDSQYYGGNAGGLVDFVTDYTFNVHATTSGGCPRSSAATHLFCFTSFSQSFGQTSTAFSTQEWAAFAEDTWRPARRLTLHAGVRYEYTLLPIPAAPNPVLDVVFSARGASSVFPEDRNNFGPRAALAWEPFGAGRGVLRAGYGLFFGRIPGATIRSALTQTALPASTTGIRITPSAEVACPQAPAQGFGYPCAFAALPPGVVATSTSAVVFDRRFRVPAIQQGTLSLERTVLRHERLAATYTLNLDRQLPGSTDLNVVPATESAYFQLQGGIGRPGAVDGETFFVPLYTSRVTPSFGPVTDVVSNVNGSYNALTLRGESEPVRSLRVLADGTWSKAIDYGQNLSAIPRTSSQFDPFRKGYDKGLSSLDYPWAVHAEAVWSPRPSGGPRWLRRAAADWEVTPIVLAHAGRPYSLDISGGTHLAGGHYSINGSGGALYLPTVGRNTLRLPPTAKADLRAARSFRAGQRLHLATGVEVFNLLNRRNVSSVTERAYLVGTTVGGVTPLIFQSAANIAAEGSNAQPFGTPIAAATSLTRARELQLSLRAEF